MKTIFNFLQIANWLYFCIQNLQSIKKNVNKKNKEKIKEQLLQERRKIYILLEVIKKEKKLHGINSNFLKNLKQIKKEYGIVE